MTEEQRRNRKRKRGRGHRGKTTSGTGAATNNGPSITVSSASASSITKSGSKSSSSFLDKMKARLSGGYFRMINEKLYTCTGDEALNYFKEDPALFNVRSTTCPTDKIRRWPCIVLLISAKKRNWSVLPGRINYIEAGYHSGYQEQMSRWPEQPNDIIIKWIKDHNPSLIVADFGCGDARIARSVKNKVYSFDLVSNDASVIACDMSRTPLVSSSVDVAVFCLSLMGTNFPSYLLEANRVLKPHGWLLIAEVKSRFDPSTGGADSDKFVKAISELGFTSVSKDFSNKMFILFYFKKKEKQKPKDIKWPELKPCLYKRR